MLRANGLRLLFLPRFLQRSLETYSESLDVIDGQGVAEQVEERILEHAAVAVAGLGRNACQSHDFARGFSPHGVGRQHLREDESVAVQPVGVLGVELHELVPENVSNGSHAPAQNPASAASSGGDGGCGGNAHRWAPWTNLHGSTGMSRVALKGRINLEWRFPSVNCSHF